jgi:hypothetical protein
MSTFDFKSFGLDVSSLSSIQRVTVNSSDLFGLVTVSPSGQVSQNGVFYIENRIEDYNSVTSAFNYTNNVYFTMASLACKGVDSEENS